MPQKNDGFKFFPVFFVFFFRCKGINELSLFSRATKYNKAAFVMKVDDDTFVNVKELKNLLASENDRGLAWWSLFHFHRSVPIYGKCADVRYPGLTYPTFPSGAGYLMTGDFSLIIIH